MGTSLAQSGDDQGSAGTANQGLHEGGRVGKPRGAQQQDCLKFPEYRSSVELHDSVEGCVALTSMPVS